MESKIFKYFKSKLIFGKYSIKYLISKGNFGEVYFGTNKNNGEEYALKIEETKNSDSILKRECFALLNLRGPGIPSVISFGVSGKYSILVENLLGKSIFNIWKEKNKKFNLSDTCIFAIQAISRLEYVHSKDYLHRDIKPANFLVGNPDNSQLYLIDFGNARKYRSSRTGKHIKLFKNRGIYGSLMFLSMNSLKGIEQTRKDELESLGLAIIYLYIGSLPWSLIKFKNMNQGIDAITKIRESISIENICKGMPKEMIYYMNYVKSLNYEKNPDYEYLRKLFLNVLKILGQNELLFSWVDRNVSQKKIQTNIKNRSFKSIYNNLLRKYSNKSILCENLKLQLNNNEEQMNKNRNRSDIMKIKDIKNKPIKENNYVKNTQLNFKNKDNKKSENINNVSNIVNNTRNNHQKLKKITIFKKKLDLIPNKINHEKIIRLPNNNKKIIERFKNAKTSSNYEDELYNKDKINKVIETNINYIKKDENAFGNNRIRNYININNININNNCNTYTYKTIIQKREPPKLLIHKKNKINKIELSSNLARRNKYSTIKSFHDYNYIPSSYVSFFSNKSPQVNNLTEYGPKIVQYKTNQTRFLTPKNVEMKYSAQNNFIEPIKIYKRTKYQPIFLREYALSQNNSPINTYN